jgi:hypothetical protein
MKLCSIPFYEDLVKKGIYAIGTVWSNCIGLPSHLKNMKAWKRCDQGHIEWSMNDSRSLSCIMWKDKCPVLLLSTYANPIGFPCMPRDEVQRTTRRLGRKFQPPLSLLSIPHSCEVLMSQTNFEHLTPPRLGATSGGTEFSLHYWTLWRLTLILCIWTDVSKGQIR